MARPRTIAISMEALTRSTENVLSHIAAATGLPALQGTPQLPPKCEDEFFSRLWRRIASAPKSTAIVSNPRYEFYHHWREAFAQKADREFFHQEAGDVLVELGYESSDSWVDDEVAPAVHRDSRAWRGGEHRGDASFSPSDSQAAAMSMCQVKVR
jgi:hypothetical protein